MGAPDLMPCRWLLLNDLPSSTDVPPGLGRRTFVAEARAGRLRAVQVGGRKTWVTCDLWIREWLEGLEVRRRRAGAGAGRDAGGEQMQVQEADATVPPSEAPLRREEQMERRAKKSTEKRCRRVREPAAGAGCTLYAL
jgi:hypothetical protein